jgi:hypothetical protein
MLLPGDVNLIILSRYFLISPLYSCYFHLLITKWSVGRHFGAIHMTSSLKFLSWVLHPLIILVWINLLPTIVAAFSFVYIFPYYLSFSTVGIWLPTTITLFIFLILQYPQVKKNPPERIQDLFAVLLFPRRWAYCQNTMLKSYIHQLFFFPFMCVLIVSFFMVVTKYMTKQLLPSIGSLHGLFFVSALLVFFLVLIMPSHNAKYI